MTIKPQRSEVDHILLLVSTLPYTHLHLHFAAFATLSNTHPLVTLLPPPFFSLAWVPSTPPSKKQTRTHTHTPVLQWTDGDI